MNVDKNTFLLGEGKRIGYFFLLVGIIGLLGCTASFILWRKEFFHAYLIAYVFWTMIGLGALFFTLLHHLVNATWSVVIQRLTESVMVSLPVMALFFLPIIFGIHDLYHWSHEDAVAHDLLLQEKQPYLNQAFFILRTAIYFLIWWALGRRLYKLSLQQDNDSSGLLLQKLRTTSGPGMVLFALTITFAAFDWLMSLDPHWYSTIFGVYVFSGSFLSILSFLTLAVIFLRSRGILREEISLEHFHDLGKLLFAFTIFWSYIAFSQYFLIWYGNIPEETIWYMHRWKENWHYVSLALVFGHFVIPFLVLLSRVPKRNVMVMGIMSLWMLLIQWIDWYWLIVPVFQESFHITIPGIVIYIASTVGIGGVFLSLCWYRFSSHPILPLNHPRLKASINFINH